MQVEALFFALLLGIAHLSEFDTREHPLHTLLGHGYQGSTLNQFLGQLERVGAAETLLTILLADQTGPDSIEFSGNTPILSR